MITEKSVISTTTTNSHLHRTRGYMNIKQQKMDPGEFESTQFEEILLQVPTSFKNTAEPN